MNKRQFLKFFMKEKSDYLYGLSKIHLYSDYTWVDRLYYNRVDFILSILKTNDYSGNEMYDSLFCPQCIEYDENCNICPLMCNLNGSTYQNIYRKLQSSLLNCFYEEDIINFFKWNKF